MKLYNESPKDKMDASKRADELAIHLNKVTGGTWTKEVWQNIGWYYSVKLGSIEVYTNTYSWRKTTYHAMVGDSNEGSTGLDIWTDKSPGFETPEEAIEHAMNVAKEVVDKLHAIIYSNIEQLPKLKF